MAVIGEDSTTRVERPGWGLVAEIFGGLLVLLACLWVLFFVIEGVSPAGEVRDDVAGNVLLLLILLTSSLLPGFFLFRWGRRQRATHETDPAPAPAPMAMSGRHLARVTDESIARLRQSATGPTVPHRRESTSGPLSLVGKLLVLLTTFLATVGLSSAIVMTMAELGVPPRAAAGSMILWLTPFVFLIFALFPNLGIKDSAFNAPIRWLRGRPPWYRWLAIPGYLLFLGIVLGLVTVLGAN